MFCNGWSSYMFGCPYFIATFTCRLVEVTYVSSTVQILENVLWINWGYFLSIFTGNQIWSSSSEWGIHLAAVPLTHIFFLEILYVDPINMHTHLATWRVVIRASIFNRSFTLSVILEVTKLVGLALPSAPSTVSILDLKRVIHPLTVENEQVPCP